MNRSCNHIILSKTEIERLLDFANSHNDNTVLFYQSNPIGCEYAVQTQVDFISRKDNFQFITEWEDW